MRRLMRGESAEPVSRISQHGLDQRFSRGRSGSTAASFTEILNYLHKPANRFTTHVGKLGGPDEENRYLFDCILNRLCFWRAGADHHRRIGSHSSPRVAIKDLVSA